MTAIKALLVVLAIVLLLTGSPAVICLVGPALASLLTWRAPT
jgi:hypothetical protein